MPADWTQSSIGRLIDELGGDIQTGPFGTKLKASEYTPDGVPVISVREVHYGRLTLHEDTPRVNDSITGRMPEFLLREGDIVFGRKGAVDRSARVQVDQAGWFLGSDGIRLRLPDSCNSAFVAYQLQQKAHRAWMLQHAAGSTMPSLNEDVIRRIPVVFAPIEEQRAIAAVLGSLDGKIEQNRRTSQALESLARATFKAWFVDFEPVKAKVADAAGFPGMPPSAFAALPNRLVLSPLGPVPEQWTIGTIDEISTVSKQNLNPQDHGDETFEHFSIPAYDAGQVPVVEPGSGIMSQKFVVVPGCVLLSKLNPRIPRVWIPAPAKRGRQIASTEFLVIVPRPDFTREFLYCLFQQAEFRASLAQSASGTSNSHQRVRPGDLLALPLAVPPKSMLGAFTDQVAPQIELWEALQAESSKLSEIRDYLLPLLLSGRVRVPPSQPEEVA